MAIPDVALSVGLRDRTKKGAQSAAGNMQRMGKVGGAAFKALKVGALAGAAAFAAIGGATIAATSSFLKTGDELHKMSIRTGVAVESLSALNFAAEQSGTSIDVIEKGLTKFSKVIEDAKDGLSTGIDALDKLGLSAEELSFASPEDQLRILAERLKAVENPTERLALAQQFLGKSGAQLIPLLEGGAAGLDALMKQARDTGNVMSGDAANSAALFNDTLNDLRHRVQGVGLSVASGLVPHLQTLVEWAGEHVVPVLKVAVAWLRDHLQIAFQAISAVVVNDVIPAVRTIWRVFQEQVIPIIRNDVIPTFEAVGKYLAEFVGPIFQQVFELIQTAVLRLWVETIQPVFQRISGVLRNLSDKDIANFRNGVSTALRIVQAVFEVVFKVIAEILRSVILVLEEVIYFLINVFTADWDGAWNNVKRILFRVWEGIKSILTVAWQAIKTAFNNFGIDIEGAVKGLVNNVIGAFEAIPNAFISGLNAIIRAWNRFSLGIDPVKVAGITVVPGFRWQTPNISTIDKVSIPRLAQGGVVTRPTLAMVGERGPEAVIPLDRYGGSRRPLVTVDLRNAVIYGIDQLDDRIVLAVNKGLAVGDIAL